MTQRQQELIRRRSSTRQFLFSKTDPQTIGEPTVKTVSAVSNIVSKAYPQLLSENSFLDSAMATLEACRKFGTMVIRADHFHPENPASEKGPWADNLLALAETIDTVCQNAAGLWGILEPDVFGCFFPGKTNFFCLKTAKKIRKMLAVHQDRTVSIGIAAYPSINYARHQIVENAYKALDHATFFGPDSTVSFDAVSLNISADKRYHEGDIDGAVNEFQLALLLDPSNVNVHNSLGVCYGIQGDYEKALDEFTTAIQLDPGEVMAIYNTGLVLMLTGYQDKALARFLEAAAITEDVFEVLFQTGRLFLEKGDPEQGKHYLEKATSLQPASAPAFRYLGDAYAACDMPDKAVNAYQKTIKLNPNDAHALSALGHLFDMLGENAEVAMTFCRQSIEISPDNGLYRHRLGKLYYKQSRFDEALKAFRAAEKLGHDSTNLIEMIQSRLPSRAS